MDTELKEDNETSRQQVPLKPFVMPSALPCEKCGSQDIYRKFFAKGDEVPNEAYGKCRNKYASGQCHSYYSMRDHLHHKCRCCGFAWETLPLNKKQVKELLSNEDITRLKRAVEHGGYLATAAKDFMTVLNNHAVDGEGYTCSDELTDYWSALGSAVYEFEKRT